jgi:NitT/TauT family transport system ATP-binding protein
MVGHAGQFEGERWRMAADAPHSASIVFSNVSHFYPYKGDAVQALRGINLHVYAGEFVCLVGPSGCGKTTLINMVAGVLRPTQGDVLLGGRQVVGPNPATSYMLANDALLPWRSAIDNVALALEARGVPRRERTAASVAWLERVQLQDFLHARPHEMSQGMRQRIAIARTLVANPDCILMDEPFAALDAQTRHIVQMEFLSLWEATRPTVLMVTHDLEEAILLSDRVLLFSNRPGCIVIDSEVPLPRPRDPVRDRTAPEFADMYTKLWHSLKEQFEIS